MASKHNSASANTPEPDWQQGDGGQIRRMAWAQPRQQPFSSPCWRLWWRPSEIPSWPSGSATALSHPICLLLTCTCQAPPKNSTRRHLSADSQRQFPTKGGGKEGEERRNAPAKDTQTQLWCLNNARTHTRTSMQSRRCEMRSRLEKFAAFCRPHLKLL